MAAVNLESRAGLLAARQVIGSLISNYIFPAPTHLAKIAPFRMSCFNSPLECLQGLARAASRYVGLRSVMTFLGPMYASSNSKVLTCNFCIFFRKKSVLDFSSFYHILNIAVSSFIVAFLFIAV